MPAGKCIALFDGETLQEHAPQLLRPATFPFRWGGHSVHLEGHKVTVQPMKQSLSDPHYNIGAVNGVVKWQHQWCAPLGNAEVPMPVLSGADGQKAVAFRSRQHLRPAFIDPHTTDDGRIDPF